MKISMRYEPMEILNVLDKSLHRRLTKYLLSRIGGPKER